MKVPKVSSSHKIYGLENCIFLAFFTYKAKNENVVTQTICGLFNKLFALSWHYLFIRFYQKNISVLITVIEYSPFHLFNISIVMYIELEGLFILKLIGYWFMKITSVT